jgi:hypothetical protein
MVGSCGRLNLLEDVMSNPPNPLLMQLGESIHDALLHFAQVCDKKDWVWTNLEGGCAIGGYFLTREAEKRNIPATFMLGYGHAWCEHDGWIYDPTVCQFIYSNRCYLPEVMQPKVGVYPLDKIAAAEWGGQHPEWKLSKDVKIPMGLNIPQYAYARYVGRHTQFDNTQHNVWHVNHNWPQGTRIQGFHIEWQEDKCRIYWKGKWKTIG